MSEIEYPEEFDRLLDDAAERMEEADYEGALPLLMEASQMFPQDPEVWQRLGASHFALEDLKKAEEAYRNWWEAAPQNPVAFRTYANLLFRLNKLNEAEGAALAWLGREPEDAYALLLLANARYKLGEEYDSWLEKARSIQPDLFEQVMTQVFDYAKAEGPGDWNSIQAADYLQIPETRLIERTALGELPGYYQPDTEAFTYRKSDLDARREMLERYGLPDCDPDENAALEVDYGTDVDELEEDAQVRVLLQKCPHCGEWTAGPLGDRERYFCCGTPMDPFIELSSEVEIQGVVVRRAGGGRALSEGIRKLTPEQMEHLRRLWMDGREWLPEADEMLAMASDEQ